MSDTIQILLGKVNSADSQTVDTSINLEFTQSISPLLDTATVGTVDLNEQFIRERDASNKYRLTLTINPFCSNVLFNACSEFIKDEGSDNVTCVTLDEPYTFHSSSVYGKNSGVNSYDMIRNSEYSRESVGFDYHPGLDFFNNHILRNKSYRIVNYSTSRNNSNFNTINDMLRTPEGKNLLRCCRKDITDNTLRDKHLYDHEDILSFSDGSAITENLREQDGWFGFYNTNTIGSKDRNGNDMDISRAINNKGNCEFIDMYPDRSLFSFVPKYNKFRNRMEANWDYQITYPFDKCTTYEYQTANSVSIEDFKVVQDGTTNALVIVSAEYVMGPQGTNLLLFRTATKHNLTIGDHIHLYYNEDESDGHWHKMTEDYLITGTGDMNGNYHDYYFYIADNTLLDSIFATPKDHDAGQYTAWDYVRDYFYTPLDYTTIPDYDMNSTYYMNNLVRYNGKIYICLMNYYSNGYEITTSYFKEFTESCIQHYALGLTNVPSSNDYYIEVGGITYELCNKDIDIQYHLSNMDPNKFIRQIINNAFKSGDGNTDISPAQSGSLWRDYISFRMTKTDGERDCQYYIRKFKKVSDMESTSYPLAFSQTIYGDQVAQSVFTDTLDISGIKGSNGQDIKDVYVTIIKANRGYKEWYLNQDIDGKGKCSPAVEFSHCFGPVTCGFDFFQLPTDTSSMKLKFKTLTDVKYINNDVSGNEQTLGGKVDITIDDEWYYGDIVEFCPWTCQETALCDVNFRFNTAQRDLDFENSQSYSFKFDEIGFDDYDYASFKVNTYESKSSIHRPEGYYYKPHYRIKLKGYTELRQATHQKINVYKAEPIQMNNMYIKISTSLRHNIKGGRVILRDLSTGDEWLLNVITVIDRNTFVIDKISRTESDARYRDWITVCENLNNRNYTLLTENLDIPNYAVKIGKGTYVWRDTVLGNDISNIDSDMPEFIFANGHHYVEETINFFLKRQDPEDISGLYYKGDSDIFICNDDTIRGTCVADRPGSIDKGKPEYEYKDEKFTLC